MSMFEACLLDYGNTVVEFDRRQIDFILEGLVPAFRPLLGPIDVAELRRAIEKAYRAPFDGNPPEYRELRPHEQMELVLREGWGESVDITPALVDQCDRILQERFVESISVERSTRGFLADLTKRCKVGLVSNYPCGKSIRRTLARNAIDRFLDPVVISGEVGYVKPHRRIFAEALRALGVEPDKVLFVGDRWDADMVGASGAGMKTCHHVGFTSDRSWKDSYETYEPDFTITRLDQLEGILGK